MFEYKDVVARGGVRRFLVVESVWGSKGVGQSVGAASEVAAPESSGIDVHPIQMINDPYQIKIEVQTLGNQDFVIAVVYGLPLLYCRCRGSFLSPQQRKSWGQSGKLQQSACIASPKV